MRKWYIYVWALFIMAAVLFFGVSQRSAADERYPGIYDNAGLLSEEEKDALSKRIDEVVKESGYHLLIATTEDTQGKDTAAYADDFFEAYNGDGINGLGLLFLVDMQHSEIYISTSGDTVIQKFTDSRLDTILDQAYGSAVDGDFYGSCVDFLEGVEAVEKNETLEQSQTPNVEGKVQRVYDDAGLLQLKEIEKLEKKAEKIEAQTDLRILILTSEDVQGYTSREYAEKIFRNHNDNGRKTEGIVYLINMQEREIYVYTAGDETVKAFTDRRIDKILDRLYNRVSDGDYYKSCNVFLDSVSKYAPSGKKGPGVLEVILLLIGSIVVGGIIVFLMSYNQGGKVVADVNNYFVASAVHETLHTDSFVNRMVTRRKIERHNDDDSPGGGSSVHRSSTGTFHGGGGRSFGGGSSGGGGRKF